MRYEDDDEEHLAFETLAQLPLLHPDALVGRRVSKVRVRVRLGLGLANPNPNPNLTLILTLT